MKQNKVSKMKFLPLNFWFSLKIEGYEIPSEEEIKVGQEEKGLPSYYFDWFTSCEGVNYQPPIQRNKFQISLWKIDEYGVAKTKYAYFTPKDKRFHKVEKMRINFEAFFDEDKFVISMLRIHGGDTDLLIFDANTLELLEEHTVEKFIKNPAYTMPYDKRSTDFEVDTHGSYYATLSHIPKVY